MYVYFNPNPAKKLVGDCVIRGICKLIGDDWETTYTHIIVQGYKMFDMPSSNSVWGSYLKLNGYSREIVPYDNSCRSCYSIKDFCKDHPSGRYLVATGSHVVAVVDGDYYDTWDSGDEIPIYFWRKEGLMAWFRTGSGSGGGEKKQNIVISQDINASTLAEYVIDEDDVENIVRAASYQSYQTAFETDLIKFFYDVPGDYHQYYWHVFAKANVTYNGTQYSAGDLVDYWYYNVTKNLVIRET